MCIRDSLATAPPPGTLRDDVPLAAMTALLDVGRGPDALAVANEFRRALRDELGVSPPAELEALERAAVAPRRATPVAADHATADAPLAEIIASDADVLRRLGAGGLQPVVVMGVDPLAELYVIHSARRVAAVDGAVAADIGAGTMLLRTEDPSADTAVEFRLTVATVAQVIAELAVRHPALSAGHRERVAADIVRYTGGDVRWLRLVLDEWTPESRRWPVPASVCDEARALLDRMSSEDRELCQGMAALGVSVDADVAAATFGTMPATMAARFQAACDAGWLVCRETRWGFPTELMSHALARTIPAETVGTSHAAAMAFEHARGRQASAAEHAVRAVPLVAAEDAAVACLDAGRALFDEAKFAEAARLIALARSLALPSDIDVHLALHEAQAREFLGERELAAELFRHVVVRADHHRQADLLVEAALGGGANASTIGGDADRRHRLGLAADRTHGHPRRDEVVAELVVECFNARQMVTEELAAEANRIAADPHSSGHLLALRWCVAEQEITSGASLAQAAQLAADAVAPGTPARHGAAALVVASVLAMSAGSLEAAERWIAELHFIGERSGEPRASWQSLAFRVVLEEIRGRADLADELAQEALAVGQRFDMPDAMATYGLHTMGRALRAGGFAAFAPIVGTVADKYRYPIWWMMRAHAECEAGNEGVGRRLLAEHFDEMLEWRDHFRPATLCVAGRVAAVVGSEQHAQTLADLLAPRADRLALIGYGGPCIGPVDVFRAELAHRLGHKDEAVDLQRAARDLCRRAGAYAMMDAVRG